MTPLKFFHFDNPTNKTLGISAFKTYNTVVGKNHKILMILMY